MAKSGSWQVAVVARKKDYHDAWERNLVKRRLREVIRLNQKQYKPFLGVVVAKKGFSKLTWKEVEYEWKQVCKKAQLWQEPKAPSLAAAGLRLLILGYRKFISPLLPRCCRFTPSCSAYALEAVTKYGFFKGGLMSCLRILRCHPFCKGGFDPVP